MEKPDVKSLSANIKELSWKIGDLDETVHHLMDRQLKDDCPCNSENFQDLHDQAENCLLALEKVRIGCRGRRERLRLVSYMKRYLTKVMDCVLDCQPQECNSSCRQTCKIIHKLIQRYRKAVPSTPSEVRQYMIELVTLVRDDPRLVLCRCTSHLNTLELSAYLDIAYVVVNHLLRTLLVHDELTEPCSLDTYGSGCLVAKGGMIYGALTKSVPDILESLEENDAVLKTQTLDSALHVAAILEDFEVAKLLLQYKADPNARNRCGVTPLFIATATQQSKLVELMCSKKGKDSGQPSTENHDRFSPVMMALSLRNAEILEIMLTHDKILRASKKPDSKDVKKIIDKYKYVEGPLMMFPSTSEEEQAAGGAKVPVINREVMEEVMKEWMVESDQLDRERLERYATSPTYPGMQGHPRMRFKFARAPPYPGMQVEAAMAPQFSEAVPDDVTSRPQLKQPRQDGVSWIQPGKMFRFFKN